MNEAAKEAIKDAVSPWVDRFVETAKAKDGGRKVSNYYNITNSDSKYDRGYIHGYRIGRINASRKILIRILKNMGKVSKKTIRKINYETDMSFMDIVMEYAIKKNKSLDDIESAYDKLSRTEQEFIDEKYCSYDKSHSSDEDD
jgi:hypothetical protein